MTVELRFLPFSKEQWHLASPQGKINLKEISLKILKGCLILYTLSLVKTNDPNPREGNKPKAEINKD